MKDRPFPKSKKAQKAKHKKPAKRPTPKTQKRLPKKKVQNTAEKKWLRELARFQKKREKKLPPRKPHRRAASIIGSDMKRFLNGLSKDFKPDQTTISVVVNRDDTVDGEMRIKGDWKDILSTLRYDVVPRDVWLSLGFVAHDPAMRTQPSIHIPSPSATSRSVYETIGPTKIVLTHYSPRGPQKRLYGPVVKWVGGLSKSIRGVWMVGQRLLEQGYELRETILRLFWSGDGEQPARQSPDKDN